MIANELNLSNRQANTFDRLLFDGTQHALNALDNMFGLDIESSDSSIEIAPALNSEALKHLGDDPLYTVSSAMVGDMQGKILVLMRSSDFIHLTQAMKPILSLLFWADDSLTAQEGQKNTQTSNDGAEKSRDVGIHEQMMDTLGELANVFFGLYTRAIYKFCDLNTNYSVPYAMKDINQEFIRHVLWSPETEDQSHLVIENEFFVMGKSIKLWCVISPTRSSFRDILRGTERNKDSH